MTMPIVDTDKVKRFQKENESWKRLLQFLQEENSHLKNTIAEILNQDISRVILTGVEDFHYRFIRMDEMMALIKKDIRDLANWMAIHPGNDPLALKEAGIRQKKLRSEIELLDQRFNKLRFGFQDFIAENF